MQELGIDITEIRYPYYGEKADGTLLTKEEFDAIIAQGTFDINNDGALSPEELENYEDSLDRPTPGPSLFPYPPH